MTIPVVKNATKNVVIVRPEMHLPRWESVLEEVPQAPTILLVDAADINRRLLKAILKKGSYRILEATRPSHALLILEKEKVDLVIVDLAMPEMSGPDFCRLLKRNQSTQLIPIVMTTSVLSAENEIAGID